MYISLSTQSENFWLHPPIHPYIPCQASEDAKRVFMKFCFGSLYTEICEVNLTLLCIQDPVWNLTLHEAKIKVLIVCAIIFDTVTCAAKTSSCNNIMIN
jgi:hypothetical protein